TADSPAAAYFPDGEGKVFDLPVELITFPLEWDSPADFERFGAVESSLETVFSAGDAVDCFVQILPRATGFPSNPTDGVDPSAVFQLRFSEPMDPESLTAFDSVTVTRKAFDPFDPLETSDYVVGELSQDSLLREVTFEPVLDLAHIQNTSETYYIAVADSGDAFPPQDLAGNPIGDLPEIPMSMDMEAETRLNGGRVSRFASNDEEVPFGFPEWAGQIQVDPDLQLIRPRPVIRQRVVLDNAESALAAQMTNFPQGVVTPFSPLGSKMQTLWRYADCGFSLTDSNNINIDVEGLWWAPAGGSVIPDSYNAFEIRLSHSRWAPDEFIDPDSLFPQFRNSGLRPVYTNNILQDETQQVVHPRERGYQIDQGALETTVNGTTLVPFPFNRDVEDEDKRFFTWRDTRLRGRAGGSNAGVEPWAYSLALGLDIPNPPYYSTSSVQTIGLPLLMEFRTVPDLSASGQNAWELNLAVNSSSRPYFRAFSTGGVNTAGSQVFIDPDNEVTSNGGYSPGSTPPGAPTFGRDNTFHLGAMDYVTRVNQSHSVWFESIIENEPGFGGRVYSDPTIEPGPESQPTGTDISFFFRGATEIEFANTAGNTGQADNFSGDPNVIPPGLTDYQYDAFTIDLYGDYYNDNDRALGGLSAAHSEGGDRVNFGLTFLPGFTELDAWRDSVSDITGARYYQVRATFSSNIFSGQVPELSAFALTWTQE
ncbi:MAG: Ig-like domain-containing protein, partial [Planctomycetota bacterium]